MQKIILHQHFEILHQHFKILHMQENFLHQHFKILHLQKSQKYPSDVLLQKSW
jgi:hypothetical protein